MTSLVTACIAALLLVAGAAFSLVAAIGLVRLPDVYTRMHAAAKAGTVGSGLLMLAGGLASQDFSVLARALAGLVFLVVTAPIGAHLISRAALLAGIKPRGAKF